MAQPPNPIVLEPNQSGPYVARFLDNIQINTESGNKQLDAQGRPLVGRHADGSLPPPNKRAFGVSQIQVGTAKDTALAHGIPFSEDKLYSDKNYNLRLGDLHMGDLLNKYGGDRTLARAAYHSGAGTVDRAIAMYGREGFAQGLGPEGRKYIQMGGTSNPQQFLDSLGSSLGPEAKASGGVTTNASAIFGSDQAVNSQTAAVQANLAKQGQTIDVLDQASQAAQAATLNAKVRQVEETRAVSDQIAQGTAELEAHVKPVFQARQRVADQLDKLTTMNPIERGLRGIFDLNYDKNHLEGQLADFDRTLQARAYDYDYMNKLHATAMSEIDRRYGLDTAVPTLTAEQAKEDMGLAGLHLAQTQGVLTSTRETIAGQAQMISAKAAARSDLLGRLDGPTVLDLANQAKSNNGVVQFNGVEFSYHELRDRMENDEKQDLALKGAQMSIQSGNMELHDKYARQVAASMSLDDLNKAAASGGVFNGITIPQDEITRQIVDRTQRNQVQAQTIERSLPAAQAWGIASATVNNDAATFKRAHSFLGDGDNRILAPVFQNQAALGSQLREAINSGAVPEVIAAITKKMVDNSTVANSVIDAAVLRTSGGDKRMAGYMSGFLRGTPLTPGSANEALTYIAVKGGSLPEGAGASDEAKAIFQQAQKLVQDNQMDPATHRPRTEAQLQLIVSRGLQGKAAEVVGQTRFDRLWNDIPRIASAADNPLKGLKPEMWAQVRSASEADAAAALATNLSTTPQNVLSMYRLHKPLDGTPASQDLYKKFVAAQGTWNGLESQAMVVHLDELPRFDPNVDNSDAMVNLLTSAQVHNIASDYTNATSASSVGDYLVNPLASGALETAVAGQAKLMRDTKNIVTADNRAAARRYSAAYAGNPAVRMDVVLRSIPGVGQEGSQVLLPWIKENVLGNRSGVQQAGADMASAGMGLSNPNSGRGFIQAKEASVLAALQSVKFQDPRMELYRKKAIAGWADSSTQSQSIVSDLLDAIGVGHN